jgi:sec-independent protein translocase protein TatA
MSLPLAVFDDWHLIVLALIVVLLFGGKKLPEVARGLGEAMREFKKASRDLREDPPHPVSNSVTPTPAPPTAAAPQHPSEPKQG